MHFLKFFMGVVGNATALFLFLAPIITFKWIMQKRSTEQFSGIPYVITLLNCLLSAWYNASRSFNRFLYGLPFVSPNNILISTVNGTGVAIEAIYVLIFIIFAPKREKAKILGLFIFVLAIFSTVALVSVFALQSKGRKLFCGFAASIFSIIMYGSPLSIMSTVIKTKSVEFMPFFLSLFSFLCGTSWFIFGLLGHDPFVIVPNGLGSGLGALQLVLYFIYRDSKGSRGSTKKPSSGSTAATADESMEMGVAKPHQSKQSIAINGAQDGQP